MGSRVWRLGMLAVAAALLTGCGSSLSAIVGSTSTTQGSVRAEASVPSTTTPSLTGEVAVAFPVVACSTGSGSPPSSQGWKPTILLAPIPTALVGAVEFYSDGSHTVLGPVGWTCTDWTAAEGASGLAVYPTTTPAPADNAAPPAGTEGVFASYDSTGRASGIALVCPFFTVLQWQQQEANCSGTKPAGEQSAIPTPDVASVTDPAGVTGSLEGSGGAHPVTGVVIFPQVVPDVTYGSPIAVAHESCSLVRTTLCPTIVSDFEVRQFPVPTGHG
jgi:hypothetical protein